MTYLEPPSEYTTQVHTLLGYTGSDIDSVWGMRTIDPVSPSNPPRGFFASSYTLEDIWEDEDSSMTIEKLASLMGKAHRLMVEHGILPIDLEWVWSGGRLCVIDFGLCEYGHIDPMKLLEDKSSIGLANDFYIPHKGDRGYDAFLEEYGYFEKINNFRNFIVRLLEWTRSPNSSGFFPSCLLCYLGIYSVAPRRVMYFMHRLPPVVVCLQQVRLGVSF
jgi:hypothetical protein